MHSFPSISVFSRALAARNLASASLGLLLAVSSVQAAETPSCEVDRPVRFGGMNWESNLILTEVERRIMEKGYGCRTEVLPTETLTALAAMERGDLDVSAEIWPNAVYEPWQKVLATGKVKSMGVVFVGRENWYIPRYTAERLPDLKSVADLPRFKDEFRDPEEPGKGRFYGCPAGWGCEIVISQIFKADRKLAEAFTAYSPGTGAAQKAAVMAALKRKRDIVFYYWTPTPVVGALKLVKLEFPPHDEKKHQCLTDAGCENPEVVGYPENPVQTAANTAFTQQAPKLAEFLGKVKLPASMVEKMLAHMEEHSLEAADVADWFLKEHASVWSVWVPDDVARRVQSGL